MRYKTREIAVLSLLTALCVVGRLLTNWLPNMQPITAILLLISFYMGWRQAMVVSTLSILITNFYLGMGIWTFAQILSFILVIIFSSLLDHYLPWLTKRLVFQVILCVAVSMLYGFLVTLMLAPFWGVTKFWPYYLAGVSFDVTHSISTVGFFLVLKQPLSKIFGQYLRVETTKVKQIDSK